MAGTSATKSDQPKIAGLEIFPIRVDGHIGQSAYVVRVPASNLAPHMASDKRYYRRYNFESVPTKNRNTADLFKKVIMDVNAESNEMLKANRRKLIDQITAADQRFTEARELLLNGIIDVGDFNAVNEMPNIRFAALESQLEDIKSGLIKLPEVERFLIEAP